MVHWLPFCPWTLCGFGFLVSFHFFSVLSFLHFHGFSCPLPIVCVPLPTKRRQVRRLGTQLLDKKGWRDLYLIPLRVIGVPRGQ